MPTPKDLLLQIVNGKTTAAADTFDEIMTNRVRDLIDAKRTEVAQGLLDREQVEEEEQIDEISNEKLVSYLKKAGPAVGKEIGKGAKSKFSQRSKGEERAMSRLRNRGDIRGYNHPAFTKEEAEPVEEGRIADRFDAKIKKVKASFKYKMGDKTAMGKRFKERRDREEAELKAKGLRPDEYESK